MMKKNKISKIPLPKSWSQRVRSVMLHIISLAQYTITYTRSWAVDSRITRVRLKAENNRLRQHVSLLTEEIRSAIHHDILQFCARVLATVSNENPDSSIASLKSRRIGFVGVVAGSNAVWLIHDSNSTQLWSSSPWSRPIDGRYRICDSTRYS